MDELATMRGKSAWRVRLALLIFVQTVGFLHSMTTVIQRPSSLLTIVEKSLGATLLLLLLLMLYCYCCAAAAVAAAATAAATAAAAAVAAATADVAACLGLSTPVAAALC